MNKRNAINTIFIVFELFIAFLISGLYIKIKTENLSWNLIDVFLLYLIVFLFIELKRAEFNQVRSE